MLQRLTQRFSELRRHPGYQQNPPVVLGRAAAWWLHCLLGIPARPKFRRWNYRLYLPAKWQGGGSTSPYLFREHYEPELMLLERFLQPGMVFVDGGANTGVFTFTAARLVGPTGRVLAFEPGAACFDGLQRSLAINRFAQVRLRHQALSDRAGTAKLYHHLDQENSFSLGSGKGVAFEEVATDTLDRVAEEENLPRVDFIKLDVEGAEELVLRGAESIIERWRPRILFELNPEAAARLSLSPDGVCRVLTEHGYRFHTLEEGELMPIERPQQFGNILAIPANIAPGNTVQS
jgi:FkbM family methyltransferase